MIHSQKRLWRDVMVAITSYLTQCRSNFWSYRNVWFSVSSELFVSWHVSPLNSTFVDLYNCIIIIGHFKFWHTDTFLKKILLQGWVKWPLSYLFWEGTFVHFHPVPLSLYFFFGRCRQTPSRHATDTCTPCTLLQTRHSCVVGHNTCQGIPGVSFSMTDMAHHGAPIIFHMARAELL